MRSSAKEDAMETKWEGRILGEFHGYASGRVFELSDGGRWKQESPTDEPVYRQQPKAKLLRDKGTGRMFLDVDGTSSIVQVNPAKGAGGLSSWGY